MSTTATLGYRVRSRVVSCAAARLPPPMAKKSSPAPPTGTPSTPAHCSASHASVPYSSSAGPVLSSSAGGHGRASRSTFPEVRVGSSATGASSGTNAAGSSARSFSTAAAWSQPSWVTT
jgi:hypothetical protein